MFKEAHPILGTRDIQRALAFYTQRLDSSWPLETKLIHRTTSGFRRDAGELHMQFQFEHEMGTMGGSLFFRYLQKEKSDLLDFRQMAMKRKFILGAIILLATGWFALDVGVTAMILFT